MRHKCGLFWFFLGYITCLRPNASAEINRSTPKTPKNVFKHVFFPKNGLMNSQNWAKQVKTAQYSKSNCFLSPFLVVNHVKRTNISPEINRSPSKKFLQHDLFPKNCEINSRNWAELVKTAQHSKSYCFLGPLLVMQFV